MLLPEDSRVDRAAGRRPDDARGQPADLGAARGQGLRPRRRDGAGGRRRGARGARPGARGGPEGVLRARRRRQTGGVTDEVDFLLSAAGWPPPTAPSELRKRGRRGLDPAGRARARAAVRAPAALEGVPARRGEARGRLRQPGRVVRGERGRAAHRDERDVARHRGADGEAAGRGGGRVRARRCSPPARTSTSCGSRAPSWRGSTTCARSATPTRSATRRRGGRARGADRRQLHRLRGRRLADREGHRSARS